MMGDESLGESRFFTPKKEKINPEPAAEGAAAASKQPEVSAAKPKRRAAKSASAKKAPARKK
jgi:predicted lipid-binding transport protein (Tim44 family)